MGLDSRPSQRREGLCEGMTGEKETGAGEAGGIVPAIVGMRPRFRGVTGPEDNLLDNPTGGG